MQDISFVKSYAKQSHIDRNNQGLIRNSLLLWQCSHEVLSSKILNDDISLSQLAFEFYLVTELWDIATSSSPCHNPTSQKFSLLIKVQHQNIKGSIHKTQMPSVRTGKQKTSLFTRPFGLTFHWATVRNNISFHGGKVWGERRGAKKNVNIELLYWGGGGGEEGASVLFLIIIIFLRYVFVLNWSNSIQAVTNFS